MKVIVTGVNGQLGGETLLALQGRGVEATGVSRADVDFSRPEDVEGFFANRAVDWVINCAAYTQVDQAETDAEMAFLVNRDSAAALARGIKHTGGRLLHVSTDFVFAGNASRPYAEDAPTGALGVYGESKLAGEQLVTTVLPSALILRTGWVYGVHGNNFVKTILRLAGEREELRIIDDQVGTPSWTADIVSAMLSLVDTKVSGTYHFSNEGVASWYDFAVAIVAYAKDVGLPVKCNRITPIPTEAYPTPASRPAYSVLSKQKIRAQLNYAIPHWRASLHLMLHELHKVKIA
jgi:dTDP-4-dehydrorhamnose reductase